MNLKKIMASAVAGMLAAGTMAASASAMLYVPTEGLDPDCIVGTGSWLVMIASDGSDTSKPACDRAKDNGFELNEIASMQFTVQAHKPLDGEEGAFEYDPVAMPDDSAWGGGLVISCGNYTDPDTGELVGPTGPRNWVTKQWWGMREMTDDTQNIVSVPTENPGEWTLTWSNIPEEARMMPGSGYAQIAFQEWGSSMIALEVTKLVLYNDAGEPLLAFDGLGNVIEETEPLVDNTEDRRAIVAAFKEDPENNTLPEMAEPAPAEGEDTTAAEADETTAAEAEDTTAAEAENTTAATEAASTTASNSSSSNSSSSSNTTTIIIVVICVVVVIAVIIIIVVVSKKKKNQ